MWLPVLYDLFAAPRSAILTTIGGLLTLLGGRLPGVLVILALLTLRRFQSDWRYALYRVTSSYYWYIISYCSDGGVA